jgi:uncharacterized protein (DUF2147 family)
MHPIVLATTFLTLTLAAPSAAQLALAGSEWLDAESGVRVAFSSEDGGALTGRIVWLRDPVDSTGAPARDARNPDPALRERPIIGLPMLVDMTADGDERWGGGTIYDARNGKTYRATLRLAHPDTLKVRGYVKVGFVKVGRTATWVRDSGEVAQ